MSKHAKTSTATGNVTPTQLHAEIDQLGLPGFEGITFHEGDAGEEIEVLHGALDEAQTIALAAVIAAHAWNDPASLTNSKAARIIEIDQRTDELIAIGFAFAGKVFSLSLPAQAKMTGIHAVRDHPALTYPIKWNTLDDLDHYSLASAAEVEGFYLTALGTIRASLDSGTDLHEAVNAATTQEELDAVEDAR